MNYLRANNNNNNCYYYYDNFRNTKPTKTLKLQLYDLVEKDEQLRRCNCIMLFGNLMS